MHTFAIKAWFTFRTASARVVWFQTQKHLFSLLKSYFLASKSNMTPHLSDQWAAWQTTHLTGTLFPGKFEYEWERGWYEPVCMANQKISPFLPSWILSGTVQTMMSNVDKLQTWDPTSSSNFRNDLTSLSNTLESLPEHSCVKIKWSACLHIDCLTNLTFRGSYLSLNSNLILRVERHLRKNFVSNYIFRS